MDDIQQLHDGKRQGKGDERRRNNDGNGRINIQDANFSAPIGFACEAFEISLDLDRVLEGFLQHA